MHVKDRRFNSGTLHFTQIPTVSGRGSTVANIYTGEDVLEIAFREGLQYLKLNFC